jgi:hypothetical protein
MSKTMDALIIERTQKNHSDLMVVHTRELVAGAEESGELTISITHKIKHINGKVPFIKTSIRSTKSFSDETEGWCEDPTQMKLPIEP